MRAGRTRLNMRGAAICAQLLLLAGALCSAREQPRQLGLNGAARQEAAPNQRPPRAPLARQQQQQAAPSPEAPKLIPLSALDRYQEGADLRLFCSASAPQTGGRLHFEWRKNQHELLAGAQPRVQTSLMDESASVLRIAQLEASDSGNYTCLVRNQFGQDASSVRVEVNVRLKWIAEPPGELRARAGKLLQLECDASGQPAPLISWTSLKDRHTVHAKLLRFERVSLNDSGLYECRATSPLALQHYQQSNHNQQAAHLDTPAGNGEQLRKLVRLVVNGKYR